MADLVPSNIHALLGEAAILLDATDNFETRYLLNDYAVEQGRPWIYAAAVGAYAATMNILPGETACLACLFPRPPAGMVETCDTAGILNTAVNFAASVEVTEALKFLVGAQDKMRRTLLGRDLWTNDQAEISAATPRAQCPVCQQRDFAYLRGEDRPQITLCGRNSVQIHEHHRPVDFAEMQRRLEPHGKVNFNRLLLRFERGEYTRHALRGRAGAGAGHHRRDRRPQSLCALYWQLEAGVPSGKQLLTPHSASHCKVSFPN